MRLEAFRPRLPRGALWVFGYASLMWAPGFPWRARAIGHVHGFHRALCVYSHRHRGTRARPGLVMGLCRGGSCWGMAYRVAARDAKAVLENLWRREMRGYVYVPRMVAVRIGSRAPLRALAFVADESHAQFAGDLGLARTARLVAQGTGERGPNVEYLGRTLAHMRELGVRDPHLEQVLRRAHALRNRGQTPHPAS